MKKVNLQVALILLLVLPVFVSAQQRADRQILVYFSSGIKKDPGKKSQVQVNATSIRELMARIGISADSIQPTFPEFRESDTLDVLKGEQSRQMNKAKIFTITVSAKTNRKDLIKELKKLPEVLFAEENGTATTNVIPADGRFNQQWNMRNTLVPGADIHAEQAWDIYTGNPNAIIAVIDGGIDVAHNDLAGKVLGGDATFTIDVDNFGRQFSHGSHVAGIAAAISNNNNNNGVAGVDWQARIHSRHVIGNGADDAAISTAIINAVNFNANVWTLNHSWSTRNNDGTPGRYSTIIRSAFAHAYRNNRVSCAAMGNHHAGAANANDIVGYPSGFNSGLIAVGATNIFDGVTGFSARGAHIDVAAPGNEVWSTNFNNNYIDLSGTSMATPHVSGLASLLKGFNTNLDNDDIEQIIRLTADDANVGTDPGFDNQMGTGRINAQRALQSLQAPNSLQHFSAQGGTVFSNTGNVTRIFLGVPGLADAAYIVDRIEIRRAVTFPPMCTITGAWGRGIGTTGYREEFGTSFGEGICEVVPGTLTNTGCTLRTWIYEVRSSVGQYLGFYPTNANNAVFQYTLLGVPVPATISGDAQFCTTSPQYFVPGIPVTMNVNWTSSQPSIATPSCSTCPQSSLTKVGNGSITLSANIPGCITNPTLTKNIQVGAYADYAVQISGYTMLPLNYSTSYSVTIGYVGLSNFAWTPPSGWLCLYGCSGNSYAAMRSPSTASTGDITLRFSHCGVDNIIASKWVAWGYGGPSFRISPNPASDQLKIEQIDSASNKILSQANIEKVEIIDKMGAKVFSQQFRKENNNRIVIPTNKLRNDVYTVRIYSGKEWKSYKVIIQH